MARAVLQSLTATSGSNVADEAIVCPFLKGSSINSELPCCDGRLDIRHDLSLDIFEEKTDSVQEKKCIHLYSFEYNQ